MLTKLLFQASSSAPNMIVLDNEDLTMITYSIPYFNCPTEPYGVDIKYRVENKSLANKTGYIALSKSSNKSTVGVSPRRGESPDSLYKPSKRGESPDSLSPPRSGEESKYYVCRTNSSVSHSFRMFFLVRDIITVLRCNEEGVMSDWISNECKKDELFPIKGGILASFQCSSKEISVYNSNKDIIASIRAQSQKDMKNFLEAVTDKQYFTSKAERTRWSKALDWYNAIVKPSIFSIGNDTFTYNLCNLIQSAQVLDNRRLSYNSVDSSKLLVQAHLKINSDSKVVNKLCKQSGIYLDVSGDTDGSIRSVRDDKFYELHNNLEQLWSILHKHSIQDEYNKSKTLHKSY